MKPVLIQADRRVARSAARQPCVLVTNHNNGHSVHVNVNDCGPYVDSRDIDLSRKAARRLNFVRAGIAPVNIRVLWIPRGAERCDDGSEMQS
jgi:rare lipoprotein A